MKNCSSLPAWIFGLVGIAAARANEAKNTMLNRMVLQVQCMIGTPKFLLLYQNHSQICSRCLHDLWRYSTCNSRQNRSISFDCITAAAVIVFLFCPKIRNDRTNQPKIKLINIFYPCLLRTIQSQFYGCKTFQLMKILYVHKKMS